MKKVSKGFSLLEVLVVLAVFSILAIVATQSLLLTLRGSKKSEATTRVRQNLDFAVATIERQIRNAKSVTCPNVDSSAITFKDQDGQDAVFSCQTVNEDKYVASSSARLTSSEILITSCSFTCTEEIDGTPPSVTISLTAQDVQAKGIEGAQVSTTTQVFLRTY